MVRASAASNPVTEEEEAQPRGLLNPPPMLTMHPHQSSAYRLRQAAWQGCALSRAVGTDCGFGRSFPLEGTLSSEKQGLVGLLDSTAISLSNPEAFP